MANIESRYIKISDGAIAKMKSKTNKKTEVTIKDENFEAQKPVIISASRSTDIPAFYSEWFINRLRAGYVKWINPFNQKPIYVSFEKARVIVFWTKNAAPMIKYLDEIDAMNKNYYFTFTVNDYEDEGIEPRVPPLQDRIKTFKQLSDRIGKSKVIWRFDPLILSKSLTVEKLLSKLKKVGNELAEYTEKLVISFADINVYSRVSKNIERLNQDFHEFSEKECNQIAEGLLDFNKNFNIEIATCAEKYELTDKYNIKHNRCIDDELMIKLFATDTALMDYLGVDKQSSIPGTEPKRPNLKDKGQRKECGCITSKDIGQYNTCGHLCLYCYANHSSKLAESNLRKHRNDSETIV